MRVCDIRITGRRENGQTSFKYDDINNIIICTMHAYITRTDDDLLYSFF